MGDVFEVRVWHRMSNDEPFRLRPTNTVFGVAVVDSSFLCPRFQVVGVHHHVADHQIGFERRNVGDVWREHVTVRQWREDNRAFHSAKSGSVKSPS